MWLTALLLACVLATSLVSGILGMAGGMILMAVLVSTVSVAAAMMIHGAVQAISNGSRAWFLRRHVQWQVMPAYLVGAMLSVAAFMTLSVVPDQGVVLIMIGIFPWLSRAVPRLKGLNVGRPTTAVACGTLVTGTQLFAGASGPLLDIFYLNSPMNRYQIIATKAVTQTLGHLIKLAYYGAFIGMRERIPLWFYLAAMATAVAGTRIGTLLLGALKDDQFRRISGGIILAIASYCMIKGGMDLTG